MSNRRLRIALATNTFFPHPGGVQNTVHHLATRLTDRGHQAVVVAGPASWWALRSGDHELPYPVVPLAPKANAWLARSPGAYLPLQDLWLSVLQRRWRFDLWHSFGTFPTGVAVGHFVAGRGLGHVVRTVGYDIQVSEALEYGVRRDPRIDELISEWLPRADRVVALTPSVVPDCVDVGCHPDRVEVVPCAVDVDRFDRAGVSPAEVRSRHGWPDDRFVFLAVGRNHPKKGFDVLLEAVSRLAAGSTRDFHVAFVGKEMDPLRRRAEHLAIAEHVSFSGEIGVEGDSGFEIPAPELIACYKAADAVVFPSLLETFGNVQLEAMAAGTPLISTDAPGCRDVVEDGVNGLTARAGDADDLADAMRQLMEADDRGRGLAKKARAIVEDRYTWTTVCDRYVDLYRQAL